MDALSEALRMELSKTQVRISYIEPGLVRTGMNGRWESPSTELTGSIAPSEPEDIARMVLYILEQKKVPLNPRQAALAKVQELASA